MVRVIVTGDDFGKSPERNRAVVNAFKQGLISSAGLIVTGKYLQDAINQIFTTNSGEYINKLHLHFNLATNQLCENSDDKPLTKAIQQDPFFCKDGKLLEINKQGFSNRISDIRKWKVVYRELIAQYEKFKEVTKGQADYEHVDFHLWYNLTWPGAIALNLFTRKYKIKSVRYWAIRPSKKLKNKWFRFLSWNPQVKCFPSCSIFYYIKNRQSLKKEQVVELFCHPNYKEDLFLDDTPSFLNYKERFPMQKNIDGLRKLENIEYISWEDPI